MSDACDNDPERTAQDGWSAETRRRVIIKAIGQPGGSAAPHAFAPLSLSLALSLSLSLSLFLSLSRSLFCSLFPLPFLFSSLPPCLCLSLPFSLTLSLPSLSFFLSLSFSFSSHPRIPVNSAVPPPELCEDVACRRALHVCHAMPIGLLSILRLAGPSLSALPSPSFLSAAACDLLNTDTLEELP